jgi:hypothetical protein
LQNVNQQHGDYANIVLAFNLTPVINEPPEFCRETTTVHSFEIISYKFKVDSICSIINNDSIELN